MWNRIKRLFRSIFGGMIERAEDPELILQQTIRDMRDKVPQMQQNVALVMAQEKQLEKRSAQLEKEITEDDYKVKAAVKTGRDDVARLYITRLQEKQIELENTKGQLETASVASKQA